MKPHWQLGDLHWDEVTPAVVTPELLQTIKTAALVEANSARFSIKSAVNAGTLVEIVFPAVRAAE